MRDRPRHHNVAGAVGDEGGVEWKVVVYLYSVYSHQRCRAINKKQTMRYEKEIQSIKAIREKRSVHNVWHITLRKTTPKFLNTVFYQFFPCRALQKMLQFSD